ncbi:hypothetical protein PM082_007299 [Marasmius tenuissimus]|nr:hypothetical protein PM082_007299 [Marasmius tenuissimus]
MFIPFLSGRKASNPEKKLYRRKGGGGGGRGGGGRSTGGKSGSKGGSKSGSKGGSKSSSSPFTRTKPTKIGGSSRSTSSYGRGGGAATVIPAGSLFAGRSVGGGTRDQIYGTRAYGSGYPGLTGRGVGGRGFPFYFWPVVWGGAAVGGTAGYLYASSEYGLADNSSRPGGTLYTASLTSNSTSNSQTTLRILADNSTIVDLLTDITRNCSMYLTPGQTTNSSGVSYNMSAPAPKPEQVIQYYRASSVALTLDGYNNTAVFSNDESTRDSDFPSGVDLNMINCVNQTIGAGVPLIDAGVGRFSSVSGLHLVGMVWLVWVLGRVA